MYFPLDMQVVWSSTSAVGCALVSSAKYLSYITYWGGHLMTPEELTDDRSKGGVTS